MTHTDPAVAELVTIQLDQIKAHPKNPRRKLPEVPALTKSIKERGILTPIEVVPNGEGFILLKGHRRLASALKAELTETTAIVRTGLTEDQVLEHLLIDNLAREDLSLVEEAISVALMFEIGKTQAAIAKEITRSSEWVKERLALASLPKVVQDLFDDGRVRLGDLDDVVACYESSPAITKQWAADNKDQKYVRVYDLRGAIDRAEFEANLDEIRGKLEEAAEPVLDVVGLGYEAIVEQLKGHAIIVAKPEDASRLGWAKKVMILDPKAHRAEECHTNLLLNYQQRGVVRLECCTAPRRHAPSASAKNGSPLRVEAKTAKDSKAEKTRAYNAAKKEDDTNLLVAIRALLKKPSQLAPLMAEGLVLRAGIGVSKIVVKTVLEVPEDQWVESQYAAEGANWNATLYQAWERANPKSRKAIEAAVEITERLLAPYQHDDVNHDLGNLLSDAGYEAIELPPKPAR